MQIFAAAVRFWLGIFVEMRPLLSPPDTNQTKPKQKVNTMIDDIPTPEVPAPPQSPEVKPSGPEQPYAPPKPEVDPGEQPQPVPQPVTMPGKFQ